MAEEDSREIIGYPDSAVFWQRNLKRELYLQNRIMSWQ